MKVAGRSDFRCFAAAELIVDSIIDSRLNSWKTRTGAAQMMEASAGRRRLVRRRCLQELRDQVRKEIPDPHPQDPSGRAEGAEQARAKGRTPGRHSASVMSYVIVGPDWGRVQLPDLRIQMDSGAGRDRLRPNCNPSGVRL